MSNRYIKIARKFFESEEWTAPRKFSEQEAWLDMVQLACFADHELTLSNGGIITLYRGEFYYTMRQLAKRWGWSLGGVQRYFARLSEGDNPRIERIVRDKKNLIQSARKTRTEESSFDTNDLPDEIDLASSEYTQSMVFRLRDREKFLLKKIEKALARIDDGSFGICERCEEDISIKRLEARPVTTLCIRCKEEQEKKEKSYS